MNFSALATSAKIQVPMSWRPLRVIGIDLGTTNSAVAEILVAPDAVGAPEARCLDVEQATRQGPQFHTLVPSVLALHDEQVYVGAGAKDLRARLGDLNLERYRNIFWDWKNDIGLRRTYHKAPVGFRSAKELAGHLLKFLMDSASDGESPPAAATVVTVPASFQAAQRRDTLDAAQLAGIELTAGALLDEPVAAFVDYVFTHGSDTLAGMSEPRRLAVFDFGGGTCDVALFELRPPKPDAPAGIGVAPLSVSRYHRLGGGDIDRKIAAEVLIPQLVEQNGLQPHELDYRAKSDYVIPALLGCAESLKVGLCLEIARLKKFGRLDEERAKLFHKNPGVYPCTLRDGTALRLQSPTLSVVELDKVLEPFLDRDLLYPRETDYLMTCSVFAPLQDALARANLEPGDVEFCLLVGGSGRIPQIAGAVDDFFFAARILCFDDSERTQTAVAHGAGLFVVWGVMMAKEVKRASLVVSPETAALLRDEANSVGAPSVAELLRLATAEQGTIGSAYLDGLAREVDQRRRKVAKRKVVVPALMSVDASGSAAAPAAESTAPRPSSGAEPARSTAAVPAAGSFY